MINSILVCNYYERNGTLHGIEKLPYFSRMKEKSGQKLSKKQMYLMLGYKECEKMDIEDVISLRRAIARGDTETAISILQRYDSSVNSPGDVARFAKEHEIKGFNLSKKKRKKYGEFADMIAEYLMYAPMLTVKFNDSVISFNDYCNIVVCTAARCESPIADTIHRLMSIKPTSEKYAFCVGNDIFIPKTVIKGNDEDTLEKDLCYTVASELVRRKSFLHDMKFKSVSEIPLLSCSNRVKLAALLDLTANAHMSLHEFYRFAGVGVEILDQYNIFEATSMCMLTCGEVLYYIMPGMSKVSKDYVENIDLILMTRDMYCGTGTMDAF